MKTLILFSTRDGQTREIASYLASELKELGIQTDVANVHRIEEPQWENYDRVVIGASIRYGHYHSAFQEFVKKHATRLNSMPSAFYSVNLVARKTGEAYSTDQQLRAEVSDELAMASRSLRGHCRGAALPTLSLV
ncbi:protoporphyrinogen oxidase [Escherichia coli]|nr:protoporphyrinogen oxidase [Escherichia coli]